MKTRARLLAASGALAIAALWTLPSTAQDIGTVSGAMQDKTGQASDAAQNAARKTGLLSEPSTEGYASEIDEISRVQRAIGLLELYNKQADEVVALYNKLAEIDPDVRRHLRSLDAKSTPESQKKPERPQTPQQSRPQQPQAPQQPQQQSGGGSDSSSPSGSDGSGAGPSPETRRQIADLRRRISELQESEEQAPLPTVVSVSGVGSDVRAVLSLSDGGRLPVNVGDAIPSGGRVTDIDAYGVTLERDGNQVSVPIGRGVATSAGEGDGTSNSGPSSSQSANGRQSGPSSGALPGGGMPQGAQPPRGGGRSSGLGSAPPPM